MRNLSAKQSVQKRRFANIGSPQETDLGTAAKVNSLELFCRPDEFRGNLFKELGSMC